jgi:hypothetical protein
MEGVGCKPAGEGLDIFARSFSHLRG